MRWISACVCSVLLASTPALAAPGPRARCAADDAALWAAIPAKARRGLRTPSRVVRLEMDGRPPKEVAVSADLVPAALDSAGPAGTGRSTLWLLTCRGGRWAVAGQREWTNNRYWDGYYDAVPGIKVLRSERLPGCKGTFLRVEHIDLQGGVDPRYLYRRFVLLHLRGGVLVTAFECATQDIVARGPNRTERSTIRIVSYKRGEPPRIRVRQRTTDEAGASKTKTTTYRLRGERFRPRGPDLCRQ
jgi:hypothetical protein